MKINPGAIEVKYLSAFVRCEVKNTRYPKYNPSIVIDKAALYLGFTFLYDHAKSMNPKNKSASE